MTYKTNKPFEERKKEAGDILKKYNDRVPVIIEKLINKNDNIVPTLDKNKYLVPKDLTMGQLLHIVRRRLNLTSEKALFIFCNGKTLTNQMIIENVYNINKDEDGFLYIVYSAESTFGKD
tara:strand:+ start:5429 stop:5788 length:360 start_codon:yes stop_codon:yes gene_type:complete